MKANIRRTQNRLEFELRLQQFIEFRRNGQLKEARQHARKHITPHGLIYPKEVDKAAGLLAFSPNTPVSEYRVYKCSHQSTEVQDMLTCAEHVFASPMGLSCHSVRPDPPRTLCTPGPPASSHSPFSRSISTQDTILPFETCEQHGERQFYNHFSVPYMFDGVERSCTEAAVRTSHQKLRRERPGGVAEWKSVRTRSTVRDECKSRSRSWPRQRSDDSGDISN